MKKSSLVISVCLIFLALVLGSCSNAPKYIKGEESDRVKAIAEPYTEHILKGLENADYSLFTTDFDAKMLEAMTETQFSSLVKSFSALGTFTSCDLVNIVDKDTYYGVNYKVTYTNKVMAMLVVIDKQEPNLVTGLWFK